MNPIRLAMIVRAALEEDLGWGDITSAAVVAEDAPGQAVLVSREDGVLAGLDVAQIALQMLDPAGRMERLLPEGGKISRAVPFARLSGRARAILSAERVTLNLLQRMSGIATATSRLAAEAAPFGVKVTDTRKTTPGLRMLEKYAVRVGGGTNHRMALDDAVLIKDNHLAVAGGIQEAVRRARAYIGPLVKVEVETENLDQVTEALEAGADVIMLDNMDPAAMRAAVELIDHRALVEASGGINPGNLAAVLATGVDFISLGWLTHSAPPLDLSLDLL